MVDFDTRAEPDPVGDALDVLDTDTDLVIVPVFAPLQDIRSDPECVTEVVEVLDEAGAFDPVADTVEVFDGAAEALVEILFRAVAVPKDPVAGGDTELRRDAEVDTELLDAEALELTVARIDAVADLQGEPEGLAVIVLDRVKGLLEGEPDVLLVRVTTPDPDPVMDTVDVRVILRLLVPVGEAVGVAEARMLRVEQGVPVTVFDTVLDAVMVLVLRSVEEVVELADTVFELRMLTVVVVLPVPVILERAEAVEHWLRIGEAVRKGEKEIVELAVAVFDSRILLVMLGDDVSDLEALLLVEYVELAVCVFVIRADADMVLVVVLVLVDDDEPVAVFDRVDESDI